MLSKFSSTPVVANFTKDDKLDKISIVFQGNAEKGYVVAELKKETVEGGATSLNDKNVIYNKNGKYSKVIAEEIAKLHAADEDTIPKTDTPQTAIEKLVKEIETEAVKNPVETDLIISKAELIIEQSAKLPKEDADEIKAAADEIKALAEAIKSIGKDIGEADRTELFEQITTAVAKIRALITPVPAGTEGGYISARSAVPKRITRMRKTRRANKTSGTRRRRRLTQ